MGAALALGARGRGRTFPNPNVGCIIVNRGRVVGRGWTQDGGRPHAEALALAEAGPAARGATLYVTLEPCAHVSKRGPACAELITTSGVATVVAAAQDPDVRTSGRGFERLRAARIEVIEDVRNREARDSYPGFVTRQQLGRPQVTAKLGLSLDGRIALPDGTSRWITGDAARAHAHLERSRHEAILVGRGTWEIDLPRLDVRLAGLEQRSPFTVVLTSQSLKECEHWVRSPDQIADLPCDHLLIEGGAATAAAFLRADLVDRLLLYRAPILIGEGRAAIGDIGLANLNDAHGRWTLTDARMLGSDRLEVYVRQR